MIFHSKDKHSIRLRINIQCGIKLYRIDYLLRFENMLSNIVTPERNQLILPKSQRFESAVCAFDTFCLCFVIATHAFLFAITIDFYCIVIEIEIKRATCQWLTIAPKVPEI